jgi:hypothetical protein
MANNIDIVLKAVDQASKTINTVSGSVSTLGKTSSGASKFISTLGGSLTSAIVPTLAVGMAIKKVTEFTKDSINETVAYNKTVREMTQVLGLGADETSRIIQVADDWGISIEAVRTSLQFMNKTGVTPSIDNLAKLADEYVASTDKAAWANEAVKTLGKGYSTLIPLLALGGDGFRDAAAGIDDSLIATDKAIAASREYEVAVDDLDDVWKGLKYTLGNAVLPVLSDLATTTKEGIDATHDYNDALKAYNSMVKAGLIVGEDKISLGERMADTNKTLEESTEKYTNALSKVYDAATMLYPEEERFIQLYDSLKVSVDSYSAALDNTSMALFELNQKALGMEGVKALNEAFEAGAISEDVYTVKMVQLMRDMLGMDEQSIQTTLRMELLKDQLDSGQISAAQYADAVRRLYNEMSALDGKDIHTSIHITTYHEDMFKEKNYQHGANFVIPPGYNENFNIGKGSSGERVIVIPKGQAGNTNNNTFNMNVHTNAQSSTLMRDFNMMRAMAG